MCDFCPKELWRRGHCVTSIHFSVIYWTIRILEKLEKQMKKKSFNFKLLQILFTMLRKLCSWCFLYVFSPIESPLMLIQFTEAPKTNLECWTSKTFEVNCACSFTASNKRHVSKGVTVYLSLDKSYFIVVDKKALVKPKQKTINKANNPSHEV